MEIHAYSNAYLGKGVFIVWSIPYSRMNSFEVFRDGKSIAKSNTKEETDEMFNHPEMFDHDHHTWLFRKDSPFKLIYHDEDPQKFMTYQYQVIAREIAEDGTVKAEETSPLIIMYVDS